MFTQLKEAVWKIHCETPFSTLELRFLHPWPFKETSDSGFYNGERIRNFLHVGPVHIGGLLMASRVYSNSCLRPHLRSETIRVVVSPLARARTHTHKVRIEAGFGNALGLCNAKLYLKIQFVQLRRLQ